jgi:hypothetical protein
MFDYIDKLRKSPEPVRRRFVLLFTISVMALVLAGWGTSMAFRIKSGAFAADGQGTSSLAATGLAESWKGFMDQVGEFLDSSSAAFEADSYSATSSAIIDSI